MKIRLECIGTGIQSSIVLGALLFGLLGMGCAPTPAVQFLPPEPTPLAPAVAEINSAINSASQPTLGQSTDYPLGPEDVLQITIFNIPEGEMGVTPRRTEVRVSQEGKITMPLLGEVMVAGFTPAHLEQHLRQSYDKYLHNPQIGVLVTEHRSQQVSVTGSVRSPGVYQLTGPKTLIDLLSMAGGIGERAGGQVHIYRHGPDGRQTFVIDLLALAANPGTVNMPVQGGDVINVQQAGMFFVDGAVGKPGSYPLNRPYTLSQALAVAGGVTRTLASYSEIAIFRQQPGAEAERIPVDLGEILDGRSNDPRIQADDVIVVPISTAKYIVERFLGRIGLGSFPGLF
jgi:polysaccharide export outer membrane protein